MFKLQSKSIQASKAQHEKENQIQEVETERFPLKIWMDNLKRMEKHNEQFYKVDCRIDYALCTSCMYNLL